MPGALTRFTRDARRDGGDVVREFDVRSAAVVMAAGIGVLFLAFFLAAFIPWLLSNGMTAAIEGLMHQVGFDDFKANTLGDWVLVLLVGAVFTAFIVAVSVSILWLYNLISKRTGISMNAIQAELPGAAKLEPIELVEPIEPVELAEPIEPVDDLSFDELYAEAQRKEIPGRSAMSKAELQAALKPKRRPRRASTQR